jgi:hypothetical protein
MQEETLYEWWQYYARTGQLIETGHRRLRILAGGMLNTARGPDFLSARFELDGVVYQGDVECHIRYADWQQHGHHLDKAYRMVVLHVTAESAPAEPVYNKWNQHSIPTLCLIPPGQYPEDNFSWLQNVPDDQLRASLQDRALNRFENKTKSYLSLLENKNENQVFYEYFLRVFGYPSNSEAFQLLATHIPWDWLMYHKGSFISESEALYAIIAGQAGFIPLYPPDAYTESISRIYSTWSTILPGAEMHNMQWQFAGVRPKNHPHLRLAAWTLIILWNEFALKDNLSETLSARLNPQKMYAKLLNMLSVSADNYWSEHYALGKFLPHSRNIWLPGESRVLELLINVILPFFAAKSVLSDSEGFRYYLTDLYMSLPLKGSYRSIDKRVGFIKKAKKMWPSQALYQAFI